MSRAVAEHLHSWTGRTPVVRQVAEDSRFELKQAGRASAAALLCEQADHPASARLLPGRRCLDALRRRSRGMGRGDGFRFLTTLVGRGRAARHGWGFPRAARRGCRARRYLFLLVRFSTTAGTFRNHVGRGASLLARSDQGTDVRRRFHAVGLGPGELLFKRETAAVAFPALFGSLATARAILAGEALAALFRLGRRRDGHGETQRDHQMADQRQHDDGGTRSNPTPSLDPSPHGCFTSGMSKSTSPDIVAHTSCSGKTPRWWCWWSIQIRGWVCLRWVS